MEKTASEMTLSIGKTTNDIRFRKVCMRLRILLMNEHNIVYNSDNVGMMEIMIKGLENRLYGPDSKYPKK